MRHCCQTAAFFGQICRDCNPRKRTSVPNQKNLCLKRRPKENPYEVWKSADGWTWNVLKKHQANDNKPGARWFCFVTSPFCPSGEFGDTYVSEIKSQATKVQ